MWLRIANGMKSIATPTGADDDSKDASGIVEKSWN